MNINITSDMKNIMMVIAIVIAAAEAEMRGQVRGEFLFDAGSVTSDDEVTKIHSQRYVHEPRYA